MVKQNIYVELNKVLTLTNIWPEVFIHALKKNPLSTIRLLIHPTLLKRNLDKLLSKSEFQVPYNVELIDFLNKESSSNDIYIISDNAPELELLTVGKLNFCKGVVSKNEVNRSQLISRDHRLSQKQKLSYVDLVLILKPQQWVKNLLVFSPLILAHEFQNPEKLIYATIGFFSFCFLASIVYVINDVFDLQSDRIHLTKKNRPFASGRVPISYAPIFISGLLLCLGATSFVLPAKGILLLLVYFLLNILYSAYFKSIVLLDIYVLASFYIIRIFFGSNITDVSLSNWFISFSGSLFMSLALVKRYEEGLHLFRKQGVKENKSRGYNYTDLSILSMIGVACGCISTLIFVMYINFSTPLNHYKNPSFLWLIGALLFYWISKIWIKVTRGEIKEDPLSFSLKDPESLVIFSIMAILFFAAIYL